MGKLMKLLNRPRGFPQAQVGGGVSRMASCLVVFRWRRKQKGARQRLRRVGDSGQIKVQNKTQQISDQALVRCEYSMANFSTGDRKPTGDSFNNSLQCVMSKFFKLVEYWGPDVTVRLLAKMDKVTLLQEFQMDAKLPMAIFENVMQLAIEGCIAVAHYIREVGGPRILAGVDHSPSGFNMVDFPDAWQQC
ncbi:hypothetical protein ACLOJK_010133 [Asimina triloba]